ncbi:hypothetical protein LGN22_07750 [Burkholderia cenocepacia]|uniref:Uncharacterized protein n=1 Tax=Burkholderia cenocepacia TaxID=95486 RepID=A0AAW4TCR3_9BURK|nr:hypothetical protein [Burkholderia cenocepacia]MCA8378774.1 hypothetical protein [Burkholderia cenocepacia]
MTGRAPARAHRGAIARRSATLFEAGIRLVRVRPSQSRKVPFFVFDAYCAGIDVRALEVLAIIAHGLLEYTFVPDISLPR